MAAFRSKRRRTSRKRKPRRGRRGRRGSKRRATISRSVTSVASERYLTKLNYSELFAITYAGFGTPGIYQFRVNSIFDPNLTGVGHQPLGHDQLGLIYQRYRVRGMSYNISFANTEAKNAEVMISLRPNAAYSTVIETVRESAYTVYKTMLGEDGTSAAYKRAKGFAKVSKLRGVARGVVNFDDQYQALIGANPALVPVLTIYVNNQNTAQSLVVNCRVDLVYYVELFDRLVLEQS